MATIHFEAPVGPTGSEAIASGPPRLPEKSELEAFEAFDEHLRRARRESETNEPAKAAAAPLNSAAAPASSPPASAPDDAEQEGNPSSDKHRDGAGGRASLDNAEPLQEREDASALNATVEESSEPAGDAVSTGEQAQTAADSAAQGGPIGVGAKSTVQGDGGGQRHAAAQRVAHGHSEVSATSQSTSAAEPLPDAGGRQKAAALLGSEPMAPDGLSEHARLPAAPAERSAGDSPAGQPAQAAASGVAGGSVAEGAVAPRALEAAAQVSETRPLLEPVHLGAAPKPGADPPRAASSATRQASTRAGRSPESSPVGQASADRVSNAELPETAIAERVPHAAERPLAPEELLPAKGNSTARPADLSGAQAPHQPHAVAGQQEPLDRWSNPLGAPEHRPEAVATPADRVRFVQRVIRAMETAEAHGAPLRIRLHPPELGSLRLEVTVRNGAMSARVEAETEAARTLLLDHLPLLRERLAEHQLRIERFEVQWSGGSSGGLPERPGQQGPGPFSPHAGVAESRRPAGSPPASALESPRRVTSSHIDIVI